MRVPTSTAPSGLRLYTGDRFEWRGNLFAGALGGKARRLTLNGNTVADREALFTSLNERRPGRRSPGP
ncbi:MAG: PQQ-dependent sugar dehydrogenase [Rubrivivax sp.]